MQGDRDQDIVLEDSDWIRLLRVNVHHENFTMTALMPFCLTGCGYFKGLWIITALSTQS